MQATLPQSTCLGRAPSRFRAVPELVTLVVIADFELQLSQKVPQSEVGSATLLILGLLLALFWEAKSIAVDVVGRLGQGNKDPAFPCLWFPVSR